MNTFIQTVTSIPITPQNGYTYLNIATNDPFPTLYALYPIAINVYFVPALQNNKKDGYAQLYYNPKSMVSKSLLYNEITFIQQEFEILKKKKKTLISK